MYGDKKMQASCRRFPTLWNTTCQSLYLNKLFPGISFFTGEQMNYFGHDRTREVEILSGCFILARRKSIDEIGVLDEAFWMYGEDVDWCWRCGRSGWKVMFYPEAEAIHYSGGSSAHDPCRYAVALQHARQQLWAKHCSRTAQTGLLLLLAVQAVLRVLAATVGAASKRAKRRVYVERIRVQVACLGALCRRHIFP
jgi:GT2 family glycosyltransferase